MKPMNKKIVSTLLCGLAMASLAGCGGGQQSGGGSATTEFIFQAQHVDEGTTYKLNLKGFSDKKASLVCAQASPKIELNGTWDFDAAKGYSFDFGSQATILAGYNAYTKQHYSLYNAKLSDSINLRLMMTYADESFAPGSGYVDPYDSVAGETLYEAKLTNTDETIKLRDYGDGTFDLMSFGENAIFNYGSYSDASGERVYTLDDESKLTREVGKGNNNYRVKYSQAGSKETVDTYIYHLSGDLDVDHAFPDPRGEKVHIFNATNTVEVEGRPTSYAPGDMKGELVLWRNETSSQYELKIVAGGSTWLSETGLWAEENSTIVFTPDGMGATPWTGSVGEFDHEVTKEGSKGAEPTLVNFHFTLALQ